MSTQIKQAKAYKVKVRCINAEVGSHSEFETAEGSASKNYLVVEQDTFYFITSNPADIFEIFGSNVKSVKELGIGYLKKE